MGVAMEMPKKVSVVVATHNMGNYLKEAMESVLRQTYPVMEVIVIDDGSTDGTKELIAQFSREQRVKYYYQKRMGQPKAKNQGIRKCSGDYIAFIDADDLWVKEKLERQLPNFDKSEKIGVVYSDVARIDHDGNMIGRPNVKRYSGNITDRLLIHNFVPMSSVVVRKKCFNEIGMFDETFPMGIDYDLWLRMSAKYDFYFVDEVLCHWRQWNGQLSQNYRGRYENGIRIMKKFLAKHPKLIPADVVAEAWAHTYVGRGWCYAVREKDRRAAFGDYVTALKYKPTYLPAWKAMLKLVMLVD